MRRRDFLTGAVGAALAVPVLAQTAGPSIRIGRLSPLSAAADVPMMEGLRQGLRDLGWIEGRNFVFEIRTADAQIERLPALAALLWAGQKTLPAVTFEYGRQRQWVGTLEALPYPAVRLYPEHGDPSRLLLVGAGLWLLRRRHAARV